MDNLADISTAYNTVLDGLKSIPPPAEPTGVETKLGNLSEKGVVEKFNEQHELLVENVQGNMHELPEKKEKESASKEDAAAAEKKRTWFDILLLILIIVLFGAGALVLFKRIR